MTLVLLWIVFWAIAVAAALVIGPRTGRRHDALVLAGILGILGLAIFAATLALDARQGHRS